MHEIAPLILDLTIMLGIASIVTLLFQRIRQPVVLGYLIAGMIIGPYIPSGNLIIDIPNIKILSELGVIFLMFSLGLEFSFHKLKKVGFSALITGIFDVAIMVLLGYWTGKYLGWEKNNCLFLGAAIAISSTTIIFKAMGEMGLKTKRFAEVIFGILIVEDLLAILLLVALSTIMTTQHFFSSDMFFAIIKLLMVVGSWVLVGYFIVPSLFRKVSTYISEETLTIVSIALCLFLVSVADYFHYSTALGAFIMGSVLAETVLIHRIEARIAPIRDIFGAIFFISIGMLINIPIITSEWYAILIMTCVLIVGKISVISIVTFLTGQSLSTAIRSGFGMAQIGEFSFIIATLGLSLGVLNDRLYPIIVAVSSITTFTTPYMIRLSDHISVALEKQLPKKIKYFMNSYSAWVFRVQSKSDENSFFKSITIRLFLNGIIIAIIFTLINSYIFPKINQAMINQQHAAILSELIAITLSSPFIWGMLFSYKLVSLPEYTKYSLNPIIFIIWFLTLCELIVLSIVYFYAWTTILFFITLISLFFIFAYRHLERSYHWFETQLINNIKKTSTSLSRYSELAPWETHFIEIEVGDKSPLLGKTLNECQIRQQYGINIVAIYRGRHVIFAPRGEESIFDNDKLVALGNDEQIEAFKKQIEVSSSPHENMDRLTNFSLNTFILKESNPAIGKSIRQSGIREEMKGLIVGIERANNHILNPDPNMLLEINDILLIVSEENA